MQIHIATADRFTDALLEAAMPLFETRLNVLSRAGSVVLTDDTTFAGLPDREEASVLLVFYRHDTWLSDPAHIRLTESPVLYAALPWPVSLPALEEAILRLDTGSTAVLQDSVLRFSPEERTVRCSTGTVRLTEKEYRLLTILYEHRGETVDKGTLVAAVWPDGAEGNVCEVNMTHLRRKLIPLLGDGAIGSIRGKGYILRLP